VKTRQRGGRCYFDPGPPQSTVHQYILPRKQLTFTNTATSPGIEDDVNEEKAKDLAAALK